MEKQISHDCPICGQPIPVRPRGERHGLPPKTCSVACRKKRASLRERARYQRVKHDAHWQQIRQEYVEQLRRRLNEDHDFAAIFRARAAAQQHKWAAKIRATDPARHEELKAASRAERAAWRQKIMADPVAFETYKAECRAWYHGLSEAERHRIFVAPRVDRRPAAACQQ